MFNNNNNNDNETDFCESYKSQILGTQRIEEETSVFSIILKLLIILTLLIIIIGVSFYGYSYLTNSQKMNSSILPPSSVQISDDDLIVEDEDPIMEESITEENDLLAPGSMPVVKELAIDKIAYDVKIAIAQSELEEEIKNEEKIMEKKLEDNYSENKELKEKIKEEIKSLEVPTASPEAKYLEELADLSKEIDKERK